VGDDDASRWVRAERPHHVPERKAVETVPANLLAEHGRRQRQTAGKLRHRAMKGGVEAGDLRHARPAPARGTYPRQRRGLMERREGSQRLQAGQKCFVDTRGPGVPVSPMHHPVRNQRRRPGDDAGHQIERDVDCRRVVWRAGGTSSLVGLAWAAHPGPRLTGADPLHRRFGHPALGSNRATRLRLEQRHLHG
jgi:hypothetical protein